MGEVYRARDARLNRDVALKVLPEVFARDPERMARFQREAQVLASLNHPNIAALYGLEESGNLRALVMELVEGATLQGPLPLDEALGVARQMADALEYAHDKGGIHRDLKPANVKVTPEGVVKVLDFGLAKALDDDPATASAHNSPTISLAATRAGVILGTAAYMSPQQARASPPTAAPISGPSAWSCSSCSRDASCTAGETVLDTLAAVARDEPPWEALPPETGNWVVSVSQILTYGIELTAS
jgi:serine/threonine-protein kinase